MVGSFGLLDDPRPRFPADRLVENRPRLDAAKLHRLGAFTEGAVTWLQSEEDEKPYPLARQTPDILIGEVRVPVVWDIPAAPWFLCPRCRRRCRHLYLGEIACRICLRLEHSSRHLHRTVPGVHRVARWR